MVRVYDFIGNEQVCERQIKSLTEDKVADWEIESLTGRVVIPMLETEATGLGHRQEKHHELKRSRGFAAASAQAR